MQRVHAVREAQGATQRSAQVHDLRSVGRVEVKARGAAFEVVTQEQQEGKLAPAVVVGIVDQLAVDDTRSRPRTVGVRGEEIAFAIPIKAVACVEAERLLADLS